MPGNPSPSSKWRQRRLAMLSVARAVLVALLIVGVVLGSCLSSAHARLSESLMGFGEELAQWTHAQRDSKEGRLSINGLEVRRMTASTPLSIKDTLDRLQRICKQRGGVEKPAALLEAQRSKDELPGILEGAYRHDSDHEGVLACIDTDRPLGVTDLARRLQQFVKTGNLADVGKLRYVLARREGATTSVLVLWTEGNAPLLKMFPKTGDAPGKDVPDMPRPENAERLLSASELGAPYGITVYRSSQQSPASVLDWYSTRLREHGWGIAKSANASTLIARRAARAIVIHVARESKGQTVTSIIELS